MEIILRKVSIIKCEIFYKNFLKSQNLYLAIRQKQRDKFSIRNIGISDAVKPPVAFIFKILL